MEIRKVETHQADEKCPVCQKGWMRPTGIVIDSFNPMYEHKCTMCIYKTNYSIRYPYVINQ
jgi:hypothetical protein